MAFECDGVARVPLIINRDVARSLKGGGPPYSLGQILLDVVIRKC